MPWQRAGECNQCGDCCGTGNPVPDRTPAHAGYCALFQFLPDGRGHCSDRRHPAYVNGCDVWPSIPEHIADKPRCSYSFRWVDGDEKPLP